MTDGDGTLPPSDPGAYGHWVTDTVRFSDQDANGHINNVAMAAYVETGRLAFGRVMHSSGRADTDFILARLAIDYRAEGHYPGEIRVGTRVLRVGRTSATLGHGVFKDGVCIASAECVIVHRRDGRNAPIEGEMRARVEGLMRPAPEGTG